MEPSVGSYLGRDSTVQSGEERRGEETADWTELVLSQPHNLTSSQSQSGLACPPWQLDIVSYQVLTWVLLGFLHCIEKYSML